MTSTPVDLTPVSLYALEIGTPVAFDLYLYRPGEKKYLLVLQRGELLSCEILIDLVTHRSRLMAAKAQYQDRLLERTIEVELPPVCDEDEDRKNSK